MSATATAAPEGARPRRRRLLGQLWVWVVIAIALGIVFGLVAPDAAKEAKWLADAFIQLIKTVTGPVIFVTVVIGIASLGNMARAGGLALKALGYFFCATVVALTLGLLAANIVEPGSGFSGSVSAAGREAAKESIAEAGDRLRRRRVHHRRPAADELRAAVRRERDPADPRPRHPHGGLDLGPRRGPARADRRRLRGRLADDLRHHPASSCGPPRSVRSAAWPTPSRSSAARARNLALLMVTFWGTCAIFVFGVLGLVARWSGFSIFKLIRLIKDELLIIVGTSSSETVLPRLLAKLEAAGASRQSVGVVIPTGYSFNLDGT